MTSSGFIQGQPNHQLIATLDPRTAHSMSASKSPTRCRHPPIPSPTTNPSHVVTGASGLCERPAGSSSGRAARQRHQCAPTPTNASAHTHPQSRALWPTVRPHGQTPASRNDLSSRSGNRQPTMSPAWPDHPIGCSVMRSPISRAELIWPGGNTWRYRRSAAWNDGRLTATRSPALACTRHPCPIANAWRDLVLALRPPSD